MDVSTFMKGYFIGLVFGASVFVWWTYQFGRFLPKEWPFKFRKLAIWSNNRQDVQFESRRTRITPTAAE